MRDRLKPAFDDSRDSLIPWEEEDWIHRYLIFGTRVFGTVDCLPNRFCVGTYFWHVYWLPIIPIGSWLFVFDDNFPDLRNVPIQLNFRSVLSGWLRPLKWIASAILVILSVGAFAEQEFGLAISALVSAIVFWFGVRLLCELVETPNPQRLQYLAQLANYPSDFRHNILNLIETGVSDRLVISQVEES